MAPEFVPICIVACVQPKAKQDLMTDVVHHYGEGLIDHSHQAHIDDVLAWKIGRAIERYGTVILIPATQRG